MSAFMQGCRDNLQDCSPAQGSYLWNVGKAAEPSAIDDQAYTLDLLAHLESTLGLEIDPGCRFATGHSLGGIFSYSLMCDQPGLLTGLVEGVDHNLAALDAAYDVRAYLLPRFAAHPAR